MTAEMNKTSDDLNKLIQRLRATFFEVRDFSLHDVRDAANALEALVKERDQMLIDLNEYQLEVEQLEGKVEQLMEEAQEAEE